MIAGKRKIDPLNIYLISSLLMAGSFAGWFFSESEDQKVHDIYRKHELLLEQGKVNEAYELFLLSLEKNDERPLDHIWLPIVRINGNGYERLTNMKRVVEGSPNKEEAYKEIAKTLEQATEAFNNEVRPRYIEDLNAINGVNRKYLEKYNLLVKKPR